MQKCVKVDIQEAVAQSRPEADSVLPLTKMEIKSREVFFPETISGECSGNIAYLVHVTSVLSCVQSFCLLCCTFRNLNALTLFLFF